MIGCGRLVWPEMVCPETRNQEREMLDLRTYGGHAWKGGGDYRRHIRNRAGGGGAVGADGRAPGADCTRPVERRGGPPTLAGSWTAGGALGALRRFVQDIRDEASGP